MAGIISRLVTRFTAGAHLELKAAQPGWLVVQHPGCA
jgi:hypothetical protein